MHFCLSLFYCRLLFNLIWINPWCDFISTRYLLLSFRVEIYLVVIFCFISIYFLVNFAPDVPRRIVWPKSKNSSFPQNYVIQHANLCHRFNGNDVEQAASYEQLNVIFLGIWVSEQSEQEMFIIIFIVYFHFLKGTIFSAS